MKNTCCLQIIKIQMKHIYLDNKDKDETYMLPLDNKDKDKTYMLPLSNKYKY